MDWPRLVRQVSHRFVWMDEDFDVAISRVAELEGVERSALDEIYHLALIGRGPGWKPD